MRTLSASYDLVIMDCPPCAGLSDVQVISKLAQGVLLVVSMSQTRAPGLHRSILSLCAKSTRRL